ERLRQLAVGDVPVWKKNDRLKTRGARVGRHGCRRIAGRNASDSFFPEPHGLRRAAGHSVVLERAGGIEALVLEDKLVETRVLGGAWGIEQRRVSFAERHGERGVLLERQQFPITPDTALIERLIACPPLPPHVLQSGGAFVQYRCGDFQKPTAGGTVVDDFRNGIPRAASGFKTD